MTNNKFPLYSKDQICKMFGCTLEQLNNQYAANAKELGEMTAKAKRTGKKVNGYTLEQCEEAENNYKMLASL